MPLAVPAAEGGGAAAATAPLPILAAPPPGSERVIGLVAEGATPETSTLITANGTLQLQGALPPGARVEIAVSDAGAFIVSLIPPAVLHSVERRPGSSKSATRAADESEPQPEPQPLTLDHRFAATLIGIVRERLARPDHLAARAGNTVEPLMLALAGEQPATPLNFEIVPLDEEAGGGNIGKRGTRFRFGLQLQATGTLQLDGLVRAHRFDLRVRTERALGDVVEGEITGIFEDALQIAGMAGSIAFAGNPEQWVRAHVLVAPVQA